MCQAHSSLKLTLAPVLTLTVAGYDSPATVPVPVPDRRRQRARDELQIEREFLGLTVIGYSQRS